MTEINLGGDSGFKVKYGEQEFFLREPTVNEIEGFKNSATDGNHGLIELLDKLGLPAETSRNMPVSKIKLLIEGIVAGMTAKK